MTIFGVFGFLMRKFGYEGAPFLLALVLGPMLEMALRQSLIYGDPLIFFKRPVSAIILVVSVALLLTALLTEFTRKRRKLEEGQVFS